MKKILLAALVMINCSSAMSEEVNFLGIIMGSPTCQQYQKKLNKSQKLREKYKTEIEELETEFDEISLRVDLIEKNIRVYDQLQMTDEVFNVIIKKYESVLIEQEDLNEELEDVYTDEAVRVRKNIILYKKFNRSCSEE